MTPERRVVQRPATPFWIGEPERVLVRTCAQESCPTDVYIVHTRHVDVDPNEQRKYIRAGMLSADVMEHFASGDLHRCDMTNGAVTFVAVRHSAAPIRFDGRRRLGAMERLALGLLIEGELPRWSGSSCALRDRRVCFEVWAVELLDESTCHGCRFRAFQVRCVVCLPTPCSEPSALLNQPVDPSSGRCAT